MIKYIVILTKKEREDLIEITKKGKHKSRKARNSYILLNCDEGEFSEKVTNKAICRVLKIGMRTIDRVKKSFIEEGLEICLTGKKSSRIYEKKADGDVEAHLIALTCSEAPAGFAKWSLRLLADKMVELNYIESISHETVRKGFKKNELKPWKSVGWIIPPKQNSDFVANMERVLDIYKRPYSENNPVVCMDESPKQLIGETRTPIEMKTGCVEKYDYEYKRNGMCNIFMASEPLKGKRIVEITKKKTKTDWAKFIKEISLNYPDAEKITLVMDNYSTHSASAFYETFQPEEAKNLWDRFEFIFTPKHGSWLNVAEIELNVLQKQCLNRRIDNIKTIQEEVLHWQDYRNKRKSKVNWRFSTKDARIKLGVSLI
ncbi:MAG: IS630 family transposase [Candidatus Cloacimonetes bacterium]|nr:IS630 family transposase [Candidatus Cloacimonadota bacterium]